MRTRFSGRPLGVVRYLIAALCFEHVLSALFWVLTVGAVDILGTHVDPICWPFLPGCGAARSDSSLWLVLLGLYSAIAIAGGVAALWERATDRVVLAFLGGLTAFKYGFILLDYRFGGNYHWMPLVVSVAILLLPRKLEAARALVVLFYVIAGFLKFTPEWLSGAWAEGRVTWPRGPGMALASAAVIVLELVLVWGLLSRDRRVRWAVLGAFAVFHIYSFWAVGFLYPLVMGVLLLAFVLDPESLDRGQGLDIVFGDGAFSTYVALLAVLVAQVPMKLYSRVPAVTGEGRIPALIMFDGNVRCAMGRVARFERKTVDFGRAPIPLGQRIQCDPVVAWNEARILCARLAKDRTFRDLDVYLVSKQATDRNWTEVMRVRGFCSQWPAYFTWLPNRWMLPKKEGA